MGRHFRPPGYQRHQTRPRPSPAAIGQGAWAIARGHSEAHPGVLAIRPLLAERQLSASPSSISSASARRIRLPRGHSAPSSGGHWAWLPTGKSYRGRRSIRRWGYVDKFSLGTHTRAPGIELETQGVLRSRVDDQGPGPWPAAAGGPWEAIIWTIRSGHATLRPRLFDAVPL